MFLNIRRINYDFRCYSDCATRCYARTDANSGSHWNTLGVSGVFGDDLGNCAPLSDEGDDYAGQETIPELLDIITDPAEVMVAAYEVVLEPDVEYGDPVGQLVFSLRVAGDTYQVTVPNDYLVSLPDNTPVKVEVGAIGVDDNATFTEEDGFCVNEVEEGCEEDDDE